MLMTSALKLAIWLKYFMLRLKTQFFRIKMTTNTWSVPENMTVFSKLAIGIFKNRNEAVCIDKTGFPLEFLYRNKQYFIEESYFIGEE